MWLSKIGLHWDKTFSYFAMSNGTYSASWIYVNAPFSDVYVHKYIVIMPVLTNCPFVRVTDRCNLNDPLSILMEDESGLTLSFLTFIG